MRGDVDIENTSTACDVYVAVIAIVLLVAIHFYAFAAAPPTRPTEAECLDAARTHPPVRLEPPFGARWNEAADMCSRMGIDVPRAR